MWCLGIEHRGSWHQLWWHRNGIGWLYTNSGLAYTNVNSGCTSATQFKTLLPTLHLDIYTIYTTTDQADNINRNNNYHMIQQSSPSSTPAYITLGIDWWRGPWRSFAQEDHHRRTDYPIVWPSWANYPPGRCQCLLNCRQCQWVWRCLNTPARKLPSSKMHHCQSEFQQVWLGTSSNGCNNCWMAIESWDCKFEQLYTVQSQKHLILTDINSDLLNAGLLDTYHLVRNLYYSRVRRNEDNCQLTVLIM